MKRNEQVIIKIRNGKLLAATIKNVHKDGTASAQIDQPESTVAGFWVLLHSDGQATPNPWYSKQLALQVAESWYSRAGNETDEWLTKHNEEVVAKQKAEAEAWTKQFIRDEAERSIANVKKMGTTAMFLENLKITERWTGNHNVLDFVSVAWEDGEVWRDVSGTVYSEKYNEVDFSYSAKVSVYITWQREDQLEERMWSSTYFSTGFSKEEARQMALAKAIR